MMSKVLSLLLFMLHPELLLTDGFPISFHMDLQKKKGVTALAYKTQHTPK